MVSRNNQIIRPIDIDDNVTIPIPNDDRGRGDSRNMLCLVAYFVADTEYLLKCLHLFTVTYNIYIYVPVDSQQ